MSICQFDIVVISVFVGVLVYVDNPSCQLNNLIFTNPLWLFHLLAHVVTKKVARRSKGILTRMEVEKLIRDDVGFANLPNELLPPLLR